MFRLNETYFTVGGYEARVVCDNAGVTNNGGVLQDLVVLVAVPSGKTGISTTYAYTYSTDGKLGGSNGGVSPYNLISNEPNEEEKDLIGQMLSLIDARDEEKLLKIIRQLRKK